MRISYPYSAGGARQGGQALSDSFYGIAPCSRAFIEMRIDMTHIEEFTPSEKR